MSERIKLDDRVVFNFASEIFKDVQAYVAAHQDEYRLWLDEHNLSESELNEEFMKAG